MPKKQRRKRGGTFWAPKKIRKRTSSNNNNKMRQRKANHAPTKDYNQIWSHVSPRRLKNTQYSLTETTSIPIPCIATVPKGETGSFRDLTGTLLQTGLEKFCSLFWNQQQTLPLSKQVALQALCGPNCLTVRVLNESDRKTFHGINFKHHKYYFIVCYKESLEDMFFENPKSKKSQNFPTPTILIEMGRTSPPEVIAMKLTYPNSGEEEEPNYFTPEDQNWHTALSWFRVADANHHEIVSHLFETHIISEIILSEMMCTPTTEKKAKPHKICKFLKTFFSGTVWINNRARETLLPLLNVHLALGKGIDLLEDRWHNYNFSDSNFLKSLENRGMQEMTFYSPGRYGKRIYNIIFHFCHDVVHTFYKNDDDIIGDSWLSLFWSNLNNRLNKTVKPFSSIERLTDFLTHIIFLCSVQHSIVNFSQKAFYSNVPPFVLNVGDIPKVGQSTTVKVARGEFSATSELIVNLLSQYDDNNSLYNLKKQDFDESISHIVIKFRRKLKTCKNWMKSEEDKKEMEGSCLLYPFLINCLERSIAI